MAAAGLGEWFPRGRGAFGSDHDRRDALVPIAVARDGGDPDVVVVGDTPRDIACAVAGGARCVAVTTGAHGPDDLAGADAVADGLPAAAAVIRGLAGSEPGRARRRVVGGDLAVGPALDDGADRLPADRPLHLAAAGRRRRPASTCGGRRRRRAPR